MADGSVIAYNVAAFISALFVLEFGADKFIDHTAIVARRTGIPDTVIALLTAGAEWEELVVVVASLAQGRPSLAVGNIVGSAISNTLGAFSLGLLFRPRGDPVQFDRSSRLYSLFLLAVTTLVAPIIYFSHRSVWLVCGAILIALFVVYLVSIGWAISRGKLTAPEELSDDDDDSSGDDDDNSDVASVTSSASSNDAQASHVPGTEPSQQGRDSEAAARPLLGPKRIVRTRRSLGYHVGYLIVGFLAICLAGYVLSHAAINIADATGVSDLIFGIVVLAIATTLPEKFVAVLSGTRGHIGILVANTVGSNIFLLSLCLGTVMLDTAGELGAGGGATVAELAVLWATSLALTVTVWAGGRFDRWIGGAMLLGYIAFIVLEFTVIHSVTNAP